MPRMANRGRDERPESEDTLRPGTASPKSMELWIDRSVSVCCDNAVMATGTSWMFSDLRRAVTTTSSSEAAELASLADALAPSSASDAPPDSAWAHNGHPTAAAPQTTHSRQFIVPPKAMKDHAVHFRLDALEPGS